MAEWVPVDLDKDTKDGSITGATFSMRVPGGMIIRNVMTNGQQAMVFVPYHRGPGSDAVTDTWIEDNKIT
jgi:hypothetical protein